MKKILEIKNLSASYGSIRALNDINIEMFDGEILAIVGANGAGKSTLLNCISKIIPYDGEMIIFNDDISNKITSDKMVAKGVIQVPEGRQIFPELSVYDNLKLGAYSRKSNKNIDKSIEEVFKLFPKLEERRHQKGGSLSGGEQQMLAIGRAMMAKPKILLLDEPSMGLAPVIVTEIANIIKQLNSEGISIILIEQNVELAFNLSNRAYILETGSVKFEGDSKDLMNNDIVRNLYLGM